jgi:hypothetical protein
MAMIQMVVSNFCHYYYGGVASLVLHRRRESLRPADVNGKTTNLIFRTEKHNRESY